MALACFHGQRPTVVPVVDPALYRCAEGYAAALGFVDRRDTGTTATRLTVTTRPGASGEYDGLVIDFVSDTTRTRRWIQVRSFSGQMRRGTYDDFALGAPAAQSAGARLLERCNPNGTGLRGVSGGGQAPEPLPR